MTQLQRELGDYCQWWPEGTRRPCYAPASVVLLRRSGGPCGLPARSTLPNGRPGFKAATSCWNAMSGKRGARAIAA
jgi:hypothetical protein